MKLATNKNIFVTTEVKLVSSRKILATNNEGRQKFATKQCILATSNWGK